MRLIEQFYAFIAPSDCLSCGGEAGLICKWCVDDSISQYDSRCYGCNKLTSSFAVCTGCRRKSALKNVFIRTEYTKIPKELVHRMKFSYSTEAAETIAQEMLNTIPVLPPDTLVISIPTITNHTRQRGFDHAMKISKVIARELGLEHCSALTRLNQQRQVGSGRRDRLKQQRGAFRVKNPGWIAGKEVILIDDVITTGATLESAAETLRQNGAKRIYAAVFARSTL